MLLWVLHWLFGYSWGIAGCFGFICYLGVVVMLLCCFVAFGCYLVFLHYLLCLCGYYLVFLLCFGVYCGFVNSALLEVYFGPSLGL